MTTTQAMLAKHTLGPYVIDCTDAAIERAVLKDETPLHTIASSSGRAIGFVNMTVNEWEANLALWRASPQLLEAANAVLADFMEGYPDSRAVPDCLVMLAVAVSEATRKDEE